MFDKQLVLNGLESSNLLLAIQDSEHRFCWVSKATSELCGFNRVDEMLGLRNSEIKCKAAEKAGFYDNLNAQVMQQNQQGKYIGINFNYANRDILISMYDKTPLLDENNNSYVLTCGTDITSQVNNNNTNGRQSL